MEVKQSKAGFKAIILSLARHIESNLNNISQLEANNIKSRIEIGEFLYFAGKLRDKFIAPAYSVWLYEDDFFDGKVTLMDEFLDIYGTIKVMILDSARLYNFTNGVWQLEDTVLDSLIEDVEWIKAYAEEKL